MKTVAEKPQLMSYTRGVSIRFGSIFGCIRYAFGALSMVTFGL